MKIYTKTGDKGETSLFGGERVQKSEQRLNAYGTIDELNSFIGMAVVETADSEVKEVLQKIQNQLFNLGADLATPETEKTKKLNVFRVDEKFYKFAEESIDKYETELDELKSFILPGGSECASILHVCRSICRRAEREIVELSNLEKVNKEVIVYVNRLSDLFFVLSRYENKIAGILDIEWKP